MTMFAETNRVSCPRFNNLLRSDPKISSTLPNADDFSSHNSSAVSAACPGYYSDCNPISGENSPYNVSPRNRTSHYSKSPWSTRCSPFSSSSEDNLPTNGLIGSLVREEGHVYSLAASGELLYTGSNSKNIRVWKNLEEYGGFKSNSGLVKAIIISGERIYTGHQDGKIRIWKVSPENPTVHKRVGTLPKLGDFIKSFTNPNNYVKVRHRRNSLWINHFDAVSCLSLDKEQGLLYSGSWDKTLKAWRIADSKCLESINAHDDAVNSVVVGFEGMVFTGSADGTVKVWKWETQGKGTKHTMSQMLLKQECAVTVVVVNPMSSIVYCGSSDGLVDFWDWSGNQQFHGGILRGHKLAVLCLAAAGNLVFSGSADKTICVWRKDGGSHSCLSVLNGHTGPVKCLAVEEDRESSEEDRRWIVYSASLDKSVKVWKLSDFAADVQISRQQQQQVEPEKQALS